MCNEGTEEEKKIIEEIDDMKKAIDDNEVEIKKYNENIEKNVHMKTFYKNQLLILISSSNTFQTNENVNLNVDYILINY